MIDNKFTESKFNQMRTEHCSACYRETDHETNGECHQCKMNQNKPKLVHLKPNIQLSEGSVVRMNPQKLIVALLLIEITLHFAEVVIDMMQLLKLV